MQRLIILLFRNRVSSSHATFLMAENGEIHDALPALAADDEPDQKTELSNQDVQAAEVPNTARSQSAVCSLSNRLLLQRLLAILSESPNLLHQAQFQKIRKTLHSISKADHVNVARSIAHAELVRDCAESLSRYVAPRLPGRQSGEAV